MAIRYSATQVELREIALNNKPPELLQASPKATVPVLLTPGGLVIDESLDIMRWALTQHDPQNWLQLDSSTTIESLIHTNDQYFKAHLDHYKYADRYPEHSPLYYRQQGETFLSSLELCLRDHTFLTGSCASLADIALFPFIRQFAYVDIEWFNSAPYPCLRSWLDKWLNSDLFIAIMHKQPAWQKHQPPVIF